MFVSRSMTRKVIRVDPDAGIFKAQELMAENKIRHLPVTEPNGRLIGIVTDRDIRSALPYKFFKESPSEEEKKNVSQLKIKDIMTRDAITISPTYTIQDALLMIQDARVGALPVVDEEGILKGIISVRDLLRAFTNVLGIGEPGTLLCILVEEKVGQLKKIVDAITEENISFGSVLVARYWEKDKRVVFPYLLTQNIAHVKEKLKKLGFTLLEPMEWYLDQLPKNE
ncbi:MAG: CBS domain-containing protein [Desulfobacterales bacterium]|jgi:acetoin utilization protein AcuB|nr:CBS domain-containing protein [Desulfobacterales bacterium]MCK5202244.1 CBS domain-containing protein [Desulfobacterales bacterium]MCK5417557.1 CBS domain-containing protein [Desulfobacterales bacterium]MCK5485123.1 CBS domain-containing protein [Desulfobacterales bacterium]